MRKIRVSDLKDDYGPGPTPFLQCPLCNGEYSARKEDYFLFPDDEVLTCGADEEPLRLVVNRITYEEVSP